MCLSAVSLRCELEDMAACGLACSCRQLASFWQPNLFDLLVQGWNAHYHPRDGASMDSESMEPYTWRKGPRVNDEYSFDDGGDPTVTRRGESKNNVVSRCAMASPFMA